MKKIPIVALQPGQRFSEPVYIEGENILVPAGVAIRKKDITRLNSWGIETVETKGKLLTGAEAEIEIAAQKGSLTDKTEQGKNPGANDRLNSAKPSNTSIPQNFKKAASGNRCAGLLIASFAANSVSQRGASFA